MIGIGLICVEYGKDDFYKKCTLKSIDYWSKNYQVTVLTNTPDFFLYKNCKVFSYTEKKFNYHDKIKFLGQLSEEYELAVLIDTNKLPTIDVIFEERDFLPGLHTGKSWDYDWKELREQSNSIYWDRWDEQLGISKMKNVPLPICERMLAIKRHSKFTQYVELIENKYKMVATDNDRHIASFDKSHKKTIKNAEGRAEGFSFALAGVEMNFPIFCPSSSLLWAISFLERQYPN